MDTKAWSEMMDKESPRCPSCNGRIFGGTKVCRECERSTQCEKLLSIYGAEVESVKAYRLKIQEGDELNRQLNAKHYAEWQEAMKEQNEIMARIAFALEKLSQK